MSRKGIESIQRKGRCKGGVSYNLVSRIASATSMPIDFDGVGDAQQLGPTRHSSFPDIVGRLSRLRRYIFKGKVKNEYDKRRYKSLGKEKKIKGENHPRKLDGRSYRKIKERRIKVSYINVSYYFFKYPSDVIRNERTSKHLIVVFFLHLGGYTSSIASR